MQHLPSKRHIAATLFLRDVTDPNPILIPSLQIDLLSVAFPLMPKDPYTGVGVFKEKCHLQSRNRNEVSPDKLQ